MVRFDDFLSVDTICPYSVSFASERLFFGILNIFHFFPSQITVNGEVVTDPMYMLR